MSPCCVQGCELKSSTDIIYFEFPTSRSLRRRWLDALTLADKFNIHSLVCSQHFLETDYEKIRGKTRLKGKVVPSLLLGNKKPIEPLVIPSLKKSDTVCTTVSATTQTESTQTESTQNEATCLPNGEQITIQNGEGNRTSTDKISVQNGEGNRTSTDKISIQNGEENRTGTDGIQNNKEIAARIDKGSTNSEISYQNLPSVRHTPDPNQDDIEEMITNYQIKNKIPNKALAADLRDEVGARGAGEAPSETIEIELMPDVELLPEKPPVFIEVSADRDVTASEGSGGDCLMLLESVQVELDPATLILPERDSEDEKPPDKKEDPISLLTSSDEDEVIIEEPHIDTVEVSDETDEDDVPLTRLIKTEPKKTIRKSTRHKNKDLALKRIMWGIYEYYCMQCHYTTMNGAEYKSHLAVHSNVLQICATCSYTTASKTQYNRHLRKHKEEKRYKCHLCGYRAKHNMSLIYHLKSHDDSNLENSKRGYKCKKCGFRSDVKAKVVKHVKLCNSGAKRYPCDRCDYETSRRTDLKRHSLRKHKNNDDDDYWD